MQRIKESLKKNYNLIDDISEHIFIQDNLMGILKNIENNIPEECRLNFYKNLETLRFTFSTQQGSFSVADSTIININGKLQWLVDNNITSEKYNYKEMLISELYHELLHQSSLSIIVDFEKKVSGIGGFSSMEFDNEGNIINEDKYNGLDEGFTQLLTNENTGIADFTKYEKQIACVQKLIDMVGKETVKKAYFDNRNGMKIIIDKLNEQGISPTIIDELESQCHLNQIDIIKSETYDNLNIEDQVKTI